MSVNFFVDFDKSLFLLTLQRYGQRLYLMYINVCVRTQAVFCHTLMVNDW